MKQKTRFLCLMLTMLLLLPGCQSSTEADKEDVAETEATVTDADAALDEVDSEEPEDANPEDSEESEDTNPEDSETVNPFEDETGAQESSVIGELEFGPASPYVDEDGNSVAIEYTGGVLALDYYAWGYGTATNFGILLFVDGEPQPFYTDGDSETAYMHYFSIEEDYDTIYFTMYLTPVTGQTGDTLTLTVCTINNAQYQPDMVETVSYAGYHDSLELCPNLHFAATPETVDWADTVEAMTNVSISSSLMTEDFAESHGHETEELEDWAYCTVYYDGLTQYDNLDVTDQETVHITILLYGGPAGDTYCVTCYANHHVLTDGENTTQKITIGKNEVVSLEFDLETSQLDDLTTFYAYICPVSTNEDSIGMKTSSILFYQDN